MKEGRQNNGSRVFWLGVILCTVYQSYRYPLQINSTGTSQTYADTPFVLQAGKFILACPLFAIATVGCLRKTGHHRQWLIALGALFLSSYSLVKVLGDPDARYVDMSFWMLFSLVLVVAVDTVRVSVLDRYFRYLFYYALGSTLIEVALFFAFGRLPALAYEGTYSVRFGGFLDDPNGFAAILFLLMGWSYARFQGWTRFFALASIVVSLLLTQSWTAIAFLMVVSFLWVLMRVSKRPLFAIPMICASAFLVLFLIHQIPQSPREILDAMLAAKQGSIQGHSFPWEQWASRSAQWAAFGNWTYNHYEAWWAGVLVNFGVPWVCVCLGLIGALIISLRRALSRADRHARPMYLGFLLFGLYFVFGSLNLPLPTVFPINFLFFLFSFLVVFDRIRPENESVVRDIVPSNAAVAGTPTRLIKNFNPQTDSWNKA